jgi:G:T-mismatch repair DNA endonuclease (very short patch repair protein)
MAKMTDSELAARVRQRNAARSERRRERLAQSGKRQLLCWITDTTRTALELEAANRGLPVGQTAAALLAEALNSHTPAERLAMATAAATRNGK